MDKTCREHYHQRNQPDCWLRKTGEQGLKCPAHLFFYYHARNRIALQIELISILELFSNTKHAKMSNRQGLLGAGIDFFIGFTGKTNRGSGPDRTYPEQVWPRTPKEVGARFINLGTSMRAISLLNA